MSRARTVAELVIAKLREPRIQALLNGCVDGEYLTHIKVWDDRDGSPVDVTVDVQEQRARRRVTGRPREA